MGVAVIDITDGKCHVLCAKDVVGKKLLNDKDMVKEFKDIPSFCITRRHIPLVYDLIKTWKPDMIVAERAFVDKFPAALIALTLVLNAIRTASWLAMKKDIKIISPMQTKMVMTSWNNADKAMMKIGLLGNTRITYDASIDPQELSEHCVDAIGHGYSYYLLKCVPAQDMAIYLDSRPYVPPLPKKERKIKKKKT